MTGVELNLLRRMFFLSVKEAAESIGNVKPRAWRRWEDGTRKVPQDVSEEMFLWVAIRSKKYIEASEDLGKFNRELKSGGVVDCRINQSIAAQILSNSYLNSIEKDK